jgi:hypothetical protein
MQLHPIMYVADQYAERAFYELFGFERIYEGDEFPGFLAIRHGEAIIGLQRATPDNPAYSAGLRWQFELDEPGQIEDIIRVCRTHDLDHCQRQPKIDPLAPARIPVIVATPEIFGGCGGVWTSGCGSADGEA